MIGADAFMSTRPHRHQQLNVSICCTDTITNRPRGYPTETTFDDVSGAESRAMLPSKTRYEYDGPSHGNSID